MEGSRNHAGAPRASSQPVGEVPVCFLLPVLIPQRGRRCELDEGAQTRH